MAIPVSSPLNIKHKHNVPYNTSLFCKATSPSVGICGYNNRDNYTQNYLHFALSDNTYKAFYQQKADKGNTEHKNYKQRKPPRLRWAPRAQPATAQLAVAPTKKEPTQAPEIMPQCYDHTTCDFSRVNNTPTFLQ